MELTFSLGDFFTLIFIAAGMGICGMSLMQVSSGMHIRPEVKKYFQVFFSQIIIYISMHMLRMMLEGQMLAGVGVILRVVTFAEFLASAFMIYLLSLLIIYIADVGKWNKALNIIYGSLLIANIVLLVVSQFVNLFYYFDAANMYHRAPGYGLSNLMHILMMLMDFYLLIKYRDKFNRKIASALWFYLVAPLAAIVIQLFVSKVQFIILATVIAAAYLYYVIVSSQTRKYELQQQETARLDSELSMATRIQAETLPNIFPAFPEREDFNVFATMNPAKEVGGDFYDFFLIDETHLGIVMADVSGKGVPAALFMMVSKILIQNYAMMNSSPKAVLETVNRQLSANNPEEMFVTVWYGCLDLESGKLMAANAGHEYPAFKKPGESFELIKDKHGIPVAAMDVAKYTEYELQLEPGSKLFLYTDGVAEATNSENEMFGTERMINALRIMEDSTPQDILGVVHAAVSSFVLDAPQFDDLTMLCLEYFGPKKN